MATCYQCRRSPGRLCSVHAMTDNMTDDVDRELDALRDELRAQIETVGRLRLENLRLRTQLLVHGSARELDT
jgi:regulator of replication initiation timing